MSTASNTASSSAATLVPDPQPASASAAISLFVPADTTDEQLVALWLHGNADSLGGAPATRIRALAAVKSLLTFGQRTGFLLLNVGAALKLPPRKDTLAERILDEAEVHTLLAHEPDHRNRVLLRLLYRAGLRVSEIAGLCWRDLHARDDGGQVTVYGKGGKTRVVLLPATVWRELISIRDGAPPRRASLRLAHKGRLSHHHAGAPPGVRGCHRRVS